MGGPVRAFFGGGQSRDIFRGGPVKKITLYIQSYNYAITHKNDAFVAKIANSRLTKVCVGIFALAERLPTSATLPQGKKYI